MNITVLYVGSSLLAPLRQAEREINREYALGLRVAAPLLRTVRTRLLAHPRADPADQTLRPAFAVLIYRRVPASPCPRVGNFACTILKSRVPSLRALPAGT